MKFGTRPKPVPGPGEVLVKIAASSINHVDLYMCNDGSGFRHPLPLILGVDGAGVIEAVGAGITARKPGERAALQARTNVFRNAVDKLFLSLRPAAS